jgi:hypothetical protein
MPQVGRDRDSEGTQGMRLHAKARIAGAKTTRDAEIHFRHVAQEAQHSCLFNGGGVVRTTAVYGRQALCAGCRHVGISRGRGVSHSLHILIDRRPAYRKLSSSLKIERVIRPLTF